MPFAQKDGTGCWLTDLGEFVVTGGLWMNVTKSMHDGLGAPETSGPHFSQALSYTPANDSWSSLPAPPWMAGRGMGACTADSLYLVAGANRKTPNLGCSVARLSKTGGVWAWTMLPPLPLGDIGMLDTGIGGGPRRRNLGRTLPTDCTSLGHHKYVLMGAMATFPDAGLAFERRSREPKRTFWYSGSDTSAAAIAAFNALYALKHPYLSSQTWPRAHARAGDTIWL